jgi:hypothetical protein
MNNTGIGVLITLNALNVVALIGGAFYAHKKIEEMQHEVAEVKKNTNKTVHKFAAVLAEFEV